MSYWDEDSESWMGLKANFQPMCLFGHGEMALHSAKLLNFSLEQDPEKRTSHAIDVVMRCPYCGYLDIFGVAIDRAHWERTRDKIEEYKNQHGFYIQYTEKALL